MRQKIAFFDIDGTLIDVKNGLLEPTKETIEALYDFQNKGNYIVAASARGTLPDSLNQINFDGLILSDGHYIEFNNEPIIDNVFSFDELSFLEHTIKKYTDSYIFSGFHGTWFSTHDSDLIYKQELEYGDVTTIGQKPLVQNITRIRANSMTPLFQSLELLNACYKELPDSWSINKYDTGLLRMDIHRQGYEKGTACQYLAELLNISEEDRYAMGDGYNDIEMLSLIQNSVAMRNAVDEAKSIAKYTTLSVLENGVSAFLKSIK